MLPPLSEIQLQAIRAQGAGGQNVNKVATAIQLRFDFQHSPSLPDRVRERIAALDDQRVTANGIVIKAQEHRRQSQNRQAALERLRELILKAMDEPRTRVPTRPTKKSKHARLEAKRRQGERKRGRQRPDLD